MIKNKLLELVILLVIGCIFLYALPYFINFIENSLEKKNNKPSQKFINIILYIATTLLSLSYIFLIYNINYESAILRILILSASLLFGMIRFAEEDYRKVGKIILFNIFNIIVGGFIFFELFRALVMK